MSTHDQSLLGPYVLGVLEPADVRAVEEHLADCADCRREVAELQEVTAFLGEAPPEAFLDGPPADGDLVLQRTLRAVRTDAAPAGPAVTALRRTSWRLVAASIVLVAGTALGGGILIGQQAVSPVAAPDTPVGSKHAKATDAVTAVSMATTVEPRVGWSWVEVKITGLKPGAQCELVVTDKDGKTHVAGSWVVSEQAARDGSVFEGGVLVPLDQVTSVEVKNAVGEHVVTTPI
jgi:anti-sigma factor RsiW